MSDEFSRLGRLKGQVVGIAERVPHMQQGLKHLRAKMVKLTRGFSTIKEGFVHISDFLELRNMVGRHEAEMTSLRQARGDTPSSTTWTC